ncbi:aldehyde oxidase and xanthine dehydrogenase [Tritrichomonas foetus]|uniref:Aldehyde oxidase and xanthine dehydrogenase n=1 Tax=Tritrichomonas foetus TaxID=1144522 RepID=A0A1J4JGF8_9EUKA|nr:aldehyde oxidase and xanthine dehydrogenase [Tritrichomonas foetus]|eukprot:OHS96541.1 aldehyde oxidase and xanthine dehydrogenase [Tritrichomonas foetus]
MLRSLSNLSRSFAVASKANVQNSIEFLLNGKKVTLHEGEFNPVQTLVSWLRSDKINLKGTKLVCGEGGCGACTVVLTQYDPITKKYVHRSVNSCLLTLGQIHGQSVTTVEHLGTKDKGLHPVQKAFVKHHAVQCGYCTPGFVMNTYSMLLNNPSPTLQEVEERFEGNICRCTGYRAIHDALRAFTKDAKEPDDITDNSECKTYIAPNPAKPLESVKPVDISYKDLHFYVPTSFEQLVELKKKHPKSAMLNGNTEIGVELKDKEPDLPAYISLHQVPELNHLAIVGNDLVFGSSTKLQDILDFCIREKTNVSENHSRLLRELKRRLQTFASTQIRNSACVAGNIACGSAATDMSNFLIGNDVILTILDVNTGETRKINMDNFYLGYRKTCLKPTDIITKFEIPLCQENEHMFVYKQALRRDDDICIVSATMRVRINKENKVEKIRLAYSGLSPSPSRARLAEDYLTGKEFTLENIQKCYDLILKEFPLDELSPGGRVEFRKQLSSSFLFRFFNQVEKERGRVYDKSSTEELPRPHAKFGIQTHMTSKGCECDRQKQSMYEPIHHRWSEQMTTGQASYTIDMLTPTRGLYGGVVMSTVPHGIIKKADYSKCLAVPGVVDVVTYKDVQGINLVGDVINDEEVFAEKEVKFVGQSIAMVLAEDNETAWRAAKLAEIEYEELPSVLSIRQAIEKQNYFEPRHHIKKGNPEEAFKKCKYVIEGEMEMGGQEQLYLETQNCIVEPLEDKKLRIYSSTQAPTTSQVQAARATGVDMKDIDVEVHRLGGGFGGKETRAACQSNMCSVAARKHNRPIRLVLDRKTDLEVSGGRHPMLCKYKVGFDENGKIDAYWADIYANCGWSVDISIAVTDRSLFHIDGGYSIPNFFTQAFLCQTNLPTNTAFRGFGAPQAAFFADEIIDQVASRVNKPPEEVRKLNMYKEGDKTHFGTVLKNNRIRESWDIIDKQFEFAKMRKEVDEFNRTHRYKKRGIAMIPLKFGISFTFGTLNQAGALIQIYKDGSILASHAGIEMGQGLNTKLIQIVASTLRVPHDIIRIDNTSTNKVPNTSPTAASSGTDLNGWALHLACLELNKRLDKYRTPDRTWKEAVFAAYLAKENLTGQARYATPGIIWDWVKGVGNPFYYYAYGAAASLVEIDLLTGDHVVHRTDLVYDVGRPINPAIDMGQVEGAFMQGYGLITMEELIHGDNENYKWMKPGYNKTNNIGYYKVPGFNDVPAQFNVSFLEGGDNEVGIYSTKAVGEPPLLLANSIGLAIKDAIKYARKENGLSEQFQLHYPLTAARIKEFTSAKI